MAKKLIIAPATIVEICSPYPEFVLTGVLSIKTALKGTETVFVLTGISY